jgi:hypothetical protein
MEINQTDAVGGGELSEVLYYIIYGQNINDGSLIPPPQRGKAIPVTGRGDP